MKEYGEQRKDTCNTRASLLLYPSIPPSLSNAPFVPKINRVLYHTESIHSSDPRKALISAWMPSPSHTTPVKTFHPFRGSTRHPVLSRKLRVSAHSASGSITRQKPSQHLASDTIASPHEYAMLRAPRPVYDRLRVD
jgi:hypothetical protein